MSQSQAEIPVRAYRRAGIAALAVLALTALHHVYGAIIYDTPWRFHVAIIAPILGLVIVLALYLGGSRRGTKSGALWTGIAVALILVFPVVVIGIIEGGYNHVIKNLAYFISGEQTARAVFPPQAYEMPDNVLFEATGILQFPLGLAAFWFSLALLRRRRLAAPSPASPSP